jgi:hypothetical protein
MISHDGAVPRSLDPGLGWAILARSLVSCSRWLSPLHLGAPDKDPGVTPWDWLAGLSTLFGLGAAPWVCRPDGVFISIWSDTTGHTGPLGPGLLGHVPLLSPRHLQTLGFPGPEVAARGSARGLIIGTLESQGHGWHTSCHHPQATLQGSIWSCVLGHLWPRYAPCCRDRG